MTPNDADPVGVKIEWPSPPSSLSIEPGSVHVWAWDYECSGNGLKQYVALLSAEECLRIQRFHFERDRTRFAVSHGVLRILLGQYVGQHPKSISFNQNEFGKPHLAPSATYSEIAFNLSHTSNVALLAIAAGLRVGVDVEEVRPIEPGLVERYFSAQEQASLKALDGSGWLEGFYNCWTRKEAILKGEGSGLQVRLDAFDVSLNPSDQASVLGVRPDAGFTSSWNLIELQPAHGFIGALASNAAPAKVNCYRFESQTFDPI
jgi:4'-phosphopantetheinyl transferase